MREEKPRFGEKSIYSQLKSFKEIFALRENQKLRLSALIFTHRQADPDALCAAYGISRAIKKAVADSDSNCLVTSKIIAPQGASMLGALVCKKLGLDFVDSVTSEEIADADLIVATDVGELALLEPYAIDVIASQARKLLIDHHHSNKEEHANGWTHFETIVDDNSTSTCEITASLFPADYLDEKTAKALLAGLMFDSQHLGIATESTLVAALGLIRAGARIDETKELLRSKPERSEVIARMKSAQRLKYEEIGKYFIVRSEVSSFQASVARTLVDLGGDVGMAYGDHEGETRISLRSSQQFFRTTKVDLGELLSSIAIEMGLIGGGHSTAASISGKVDGPVLVDTIVGRLRTRLPD